MQWVFETLGIDRDADARAVRKAYAKAIKSCDPAKEAERFQRIRQAYEWALQWSERREPPSPPAVPRAMDIRDEEEQADESAHHARPVSVVVQPEKKPAHHPDMGDADRLSIEVLEELKTAIAASNAAPIAETLARHSNDVRLTSLDTKALFELRTLILCFGAPLNIPLLDAACHAFAWETSNRHLAQVRPDLVRRMLRQQTLLRLLAERRDLGILIDAVKFHARAQVVPALPRPWQLGNVGQLIERYAGFRQELDERFGAEVIAWWREQYIPSSGQGGGVAEHLAHLPPPSAGRVAKKPAKRGMGPVWGLVLVFMMVNIVAHLLGGSSPSSVMAPRSAQPAMPPVNLGVLGRSTAESNTRPTPFYKLSVDPAPPSRREAPITDPAAGRRDYQMAVSYDRGEGVPQNDVRAIEFYEQSAKEGYGPAQYELAQRFLDGREEAKDPATARYWWEKAANQGNVAAQFALGNLLARIGANKDYAAAAHWWQIAALRGEPRSEEGMGWLALNGFGVPQNNQVAYYWLRKAAGKGNGLATAELASMYEHGTAPVRSQRIAYALLSLATIKDRALQAYVARDLARVGSGFTQAQRESAFTLTDALRSRDSFEARLVKAEQEEGKSNR